MDCAGKRRRTIPPPITYKPELTRSIHEASEAVVLAHTMRVVFCALRLYRTSGAEVLLLVIDNYILNYIVRKWKSGY